LDEEISKKLESIIIIIKSSPCEDAKKNWLTSSVSTRLYYVNY
jgi:hypothetical protein